jgi:hypothetical protein
MQLSLPTQILPDAVAAAAAATSNSAAGGVIPAAGTPVSGAAFETFFPDCTATGKPAAPTTEVKDGENAAALLTASLWMPPPPAVPPVVPAATDTLTEGEGQGASEPNGDAAQAGPGFGPGDLGLSGRQNFSGRQFSTATSVRSFVPPTQTWSTTAKPGVRAAGMTGQPGATVEISSPKQIAATSVAVAAGETPAADISAAVPTSTPGRLSRAKVAGKCDPQAPIAIAATAPLPVPVQAEVQIAGQAPLAVAVQSPVPTPFAPASADSAMAAAPQPRTLELMGNLPVPPRPAPAVIPSGTKRPITIEATSARVGTVSADFAMPTVGENAVVVPVAEAQPVIAPLTPAQPAPVAAPLAEKFAADQADISLSLANDNLSDKKEILSAGHKSLTAEVPAVGISVAKVVASMSAASANRSKSTPTTSAAPVVSVSVPTSFAVGPASAEAPAPVATPRETMAAVVHAVEALERHEDASQKSVDLKFQVGGEKLDLRVELKDGTVHTTFRTESAELRTALATEWRATVPAESGANVRLAEPVFNSASSNGESAFGSAGQGAPQQRSPQDRAPAAFSLPQEFSDAGSTESVSVTAVVPTARPVSLLNAFA